VSDGSSFSYAVYRVVPRVERGERINVGVVVFARTLDYLGARTQLDEQRLAALWPAVDPATIRPHLDAIERIARGDMDAGPIAALDTTARFHWLVAPSSSAHRAVRRARGRARQALRLARRSAGLAVLLDQDACHRLRTLRGIHVALAGLDDRALHEDVE
jgi:hypothetical protein